MSALIGLMPSSSIKKLLADTIQDPQLADQIPRAEIYLRVHDPLLFFERSLRAGVKLLSQVQKKPLWLRIEVKLICHAHFSEVFFRSFRIEESL